MAITGWREFPAFVGGRRAAKAGKGRTDSGKRCLAERSALDAALAAVAWATEDEG